MQAQPCNAYSDTSIQLHKIKEKKFCSEICIQKQIKVEKEKIRVIFANETRSIAIEASVDDYVIRKHIKACNDYWFVMFLESYLNVGTRD